MAFRTLFTLLGLSVITGVFFVAGWELVLKDILLPSSDGELAASLLGRHADRILGGLLFSLAFLFAAFAVLKICPRFRDQDETEKFAGFSLAHAQDPFFIVQQDARFFYVNDAACESLGYSQEELLSMSVVDIDPDLTKGAWAAVWGRSEDTGISQFQSRHKRKDGTIFPVEVRVSVINADGEKYHLSSARDITARLEAESLLRLAQFSLDHAGDPAFITRRDARIFYANDAACESLGYTREEILGLTIRDIDPDVNWDNWDQNWEEAKKRGVSQVETRHKRKDGTIFPVEIRIHSIEFEGQEFHFSTVRDISERIETDRLLKLTQFSLDHTQDAFYGMNEDSYLFYVNNAACEDLGYSREELLKLSIPDIDPDASHEGWPRHWAELREIRTNRFESTHRRKDGTLFPVEVVVNFVEYEGEEYNFASVRDITERKKLEDTLRQSQKLEVMGQVTGGIAHEFNNMLMGIQGNLELIEEAVGHDADLQKFIQTVILSADRGKNLTRDLMSYSRIRHLSPEPTDLPLFVDKFREKFRPVFGETITIEISASGKIHRVNIDHGELEGALLNLVVNARDAMPGGGRITMELANVHLDKNVATKEKGLIAGDYVTLSLSDTGVGIPSDVIERVFDPFFTTKDIGAGTGLGLSMVYGFAQQSGGGVEIKSTPGKGTTVRLYLPRVESKGDVPEETKETPSVQTAARGTETLLLVEDSPEVLDVTAGLLESLGYTVLKAGDGPSALAILQERNDIDLLLSDMVMPRNMSGSDLAQQGMALHPGLKVLLATGYNPEDVGLSKKDGVALPVISKPFNKLSLSQKLRGILDGTSQV